jgi:hypothetical protein|tara:strand:- start:11809 stop:11994 length:186 start_codon:yes stop_codon:yes gene_type:complete
MFTPREKFIIKVCEELHDDVADTCDSLLDIDKQQAKSSVRRLVGAVDILQNLIKEDDETEI